MTTSALAFAVNGMHTRSNNFMVDGADSNESNRTGMAQQINNPDTIAEVRVITSQFPAEYGRLAGSVVNIVTKSGTNDPHGSLYWFYNGNALNARSNLDKLTFTKAPWRVEDQFGATIGGPIKKGKTFFFGSLLRWTDRRLASGAAITGAPTAEGQSILRDIAGTRPGSFRSATAFRSEPSSTMRSTRATMASRRLASTTQASVCRGTPTGATAGS